MRSPRSSKPQSSQVSTPRKHPDLPSVSGKFPTLRFGRITTRPSVAKPRARQTAPPMRVKLKLQRGRDEKNRVAETPPLRQATDGDSQKRILVVDDDETVRKLVSTVLRRHGYAVDDAKDGGDGLLKVGAAGDSGYHLILLDLMMPNISGFDFIEHFKVHQPNMLKRVVVMTASPKIDHKKMHFELIRGLIEKPFDINELATFVELQIEAIQA